MGKIIRYLKKERPFEKENYVKLHIQSCKLDKGPGERPSSIPCHPHGEHIQRPLECIEHQIASSGRLHSQLGGLPSYYEASVGEAHTQGQGMEENRQGHACYGLPCQ